MADSSSMVAPRAEKAYEKYAWIILFVLGLIAVGQAISFELVGPQARAIALQNLTGLTWDDVLAKVPGIGSFLALLQRNLDSFAIGFGISVMTISRFSYRNGEQWAWYTLWLVPVVFLSIALNDFSGGLLLFGLGRISLIVLSLLGLLLPYRKFFPRK